MSSEARRIAVVGAGIAGLAAARELSTRFAVTLYEAEARCGGHAHTVDVTIGGVTHGVDTGFLVLNERTYPQLLKLFAELGIELAPADMSFSVQVPDAGLEWSGSNLDGVFAQRRNLARPAFLRMLRDLLRFNRIATAIAAAPADACGGGSDQTIGDLLRRERFSDAFRDWYFLPMIGSIWSCPTDQMLRFPLATMLRFCHNHGLLQIADRPQWFSVPGGSRRYVEKIVAGLADVRSDTPVCSVRRAAATPDRPPGVLIATDAGTERYDDVVLACHSDQALALLADPTPAEQDVLRAIRYHRNRAVLHTDASVLPTRRRAWAAWNYERAALESRERTSVCLHYLINRLQPLPFDVPVIVSLNPLAEPRAETVHGRYDYAHPVFDAPALAAQQRLPALQGVGGTWFCGAWTRHGFHEDGLSSGLSVASAIAERAVSAETSAPHGAELALPLAA